MKCELLREDLQYRTCWGNLNINKAPAGFNRLGLGPAAESCKDGNICSGNIKRENSLDQLSNYYLRTKFHRISCLITVFIQNDPSL